MNKGEHLLDVCAMGEMIIDCTPNGFSESGLPVFMGNPGGAPCNVAVCLAKLGRRTAYIGKVGNDLFGVCFKKILSDYGIYTEGIMKEAGLNTTLSFVNIDETGNRSFEFYREGTADVLLRKQEIDLSIIEKCKIFHFGSVSLTAPVTREATWFAVEYARNCGKLISYDPNYRANLWNDEKTARECMLKGLELSDIVKMSDEELVILSDTEGSMEEQARFLFEKYDLKLLFITLGAKGAYGLSEKDCVWMPAFDVAVVDTNGAGDAFTGSCLYYLLELDKNIDLISRDELKKCVEFANAGGSLSTTAGGAIPAMPDLKSVNACIDAARFIEEK